MTLHRGAAGYVWHTDSLAARSRPRPPSASSRSPFKERVQGVVIGVAGVTISEVFFDGTVATIIRWIGDLL